MSNGTSQNHRISLAQAKKMIQLFRNSRDKILQPEYATPEIIPNSEMFSKEAIEQVLNQKGCTGLRIYFGMSDDLKLHSILLGVNEKGENILKTTAATTEETLDEEAIILEESLRCPPICPPPSDVDG